MNITKVISTTIRNGLRVIKHSPFKGVIRTNELLTPFGLDSNPPPGLKGIVASTTSKGRGAILGFFNKLLFSALGEYRTYSTDSAGNAIVTEIHQKNDGTITVKAAIPGGGPLFEMEINASGNVNITSPLTSWTGDLNITGDLVVNGIDFLTHTHPYLNGVTPSTTGPPQ